MKETYEVEVELKHKERTVFFQKALLMDDYSGLETLLTLARAKKAPLDTLIVFLSVGEDLLNIWEYRTDQNNIESTIVRASQQVERYVKKLEGINGN